MNGNNIGNFFSPKSIVIIGASSKEKSIGYEITKTILSYNYTGKIYLTNPNAESILGIPCYKNVNDIKEQIDLAIIVVPKQFVEESIDMLLVKNVKSIVLITAGFKETGKDGEETEKRIAQKVKNAGAKLVGPNCMGAISALEDIHLNATFIAERPIFGKTAFASQSGALGAAVLNSLRDTDIRFAYFISIGNKADINENDLIEYWMTDDNIKTVSMYLESFVNGHKFIELFLNNKITKPVIILKAGKTAGGIKAASSHTGALSSSDKVVDAVLNQFGVIRVDNINDLFNTAKGFENFPMPKGNRIAVLTNSGGPAILAVDKLEPNGLVLAEFSDLTKAKLKEIVHPEGSVNNPVDLLPGGNGAIFKTAAEIILADENVDAIISIFVEPVMVQPFPVAEAINQIKSDKPIFQVAMPIPEFWDYYKENSEYNIPIFRNPEDPALIISNLLFYNKHKNSKILNSKRCALTINENSNKFNFSSGFISPQNIDKIFKHYGIPVIEEFLIDAEEYVNYTPTNYPIVVKGINENETHKSDLGGVILNIKSHDEYILACKKIQSNFANHNIIVEKFLIQPFIKAKYELLIGGVRDSSFGPTISFGLGGKYVELFADISVKSAYICEEDIDDMINSTKAGKMIKGLRGEKSIDTEKLKNIILGCAKMMIENGNISEFDINPLVVSADNEFYAIDSRVKFS